MGFMFPKNLRLTFILSIIIALTQLISAQIAPLLSGSEVGVGTFSTSNLSDNYDELLNQYFNNPNVSTVISSTPCGSSSSQGCLWVPWMTSSSSCLVSNLHSGANCNSGETIDFTHNCMVSDELSQVCVEAAMGIKHRQFLHITQKSSIVLTTAS